VRDSFGASDYAYLLEQLYEACTNHAGARVDAVEGIVTSVGDKDDTEGSTNVDGESGEDESTPPPPPQPSEPLSSEHLQLALAVAAQLFGASRSSVRAGIFVPDEHNCLSRADTLVYNDSVRCAFFRHFFPRLLV
jgi:hypothetical protein